MRSAAAAGEATTTVSAAAATASCRIIGGMVTAVSEGLRRDARRRPVLAKHVGNVALKVLQKGQRHPVDDGRAVERVHRRDAALAPVARLESAGLIVGGVRDRGRLAVALL